MKPTDSKIVLEKMIRYLDEALPIKGAAHANLRDEIERFLKASGKDGLDFIQPPYVEVSAEYKASPKSLTEMANDHLLLSETTAALAGYWDCDPDKWHLYAHQASALEALGHYDGNAKPKHLVICTGTGSGKTESFLIPIVDAIMRERKEQGADYKSHVRALILYPMNALVNDQVSRLRKMLKNLPVTFGKYINIQETKQRATATSTTKWRETWTEEKIQVLPRADVVSEAECALPNEYRYRNEWRPVSEGGRGPADILITNFAMLERLLLAPETHLFDDPWQFIVLDEAHSYTGSTGTEIAWLMRRLEHRLSTNAVKQGQTLSLQYVAASATLSDSKVHAEKASAARKFAREIFPIDDANDIDVEFGEYEAPAEAQGMPLPNVNGQEQDLIGFAMTNEALIERTKKYEERKARADRTPNRISTLQAVVTGDGHGLAASDLFSLAWFFKDELLDINLSHVSIRVTDSIKCMADLALSRYSRSRTDDRKRNAWKAFLHDPLLHQPAVGHGEEYVGNRIGVYDEWMRIHEGSAETISYTVFYYLYLAIAEIVRDLDSLGKGIDVEFAGLKCFVTDAVVQSMSGKIDEMEATLNGTAAEGQEINDAWRSLLPMPGEGTVDAGYGARLYAALRHQAVIAQFRSQVFEPDGVSPAIPKTFPQIAEACGVDPLALQRVLELAGLAVAAGRRKPLVDLKYHQVVRDITDIGIYFDGGDPTHPHLVRTEAEFAATESREKIFTLGICRDCGQPYLLGYLDDRIDSNGPMPAASMRAYRSKTDDYRYLHAFALTAPEDIEKPAADGFPKSARTAAPVYINLITGELRNQPRDGFLSAYWVMGPGTARGQEEFISQCNRCGCSAREGNGRDVRYGNITPYEAEGLQFKIHLLDAFATCAEPDTDPAVVGSTVGEGRKVLSFSDSRSQAARLALNFELVKNSDFAAYLALLAMGEYHFDVEKDAQYAADKTNLLKYKRFMTEEQYQGELARITQEALARNAGAPTLSTVIGPLPGFYASIVRDAARGMFYPQILELEGREVGGQPNRFVDDPVAVARYLFLQTLQESRRNGLLASGKIALSSKTINGLPDESVTREFCGTGISDVAKAREALNEIFATMVSDRCICIPEGQLPTEVKSRHNRPLLSDGAFVSVLPNAVFARIVRRYGVAEDSLRQWLKKAWNLFRDAEHNRQQPFLKSYPRQIWRNGTMQPESGYALDYNVLCDDLQVVLTEEGQKALSSRVMPFVIEEHTAQINSALGSVYQRAFSEGRINILSCSTTFEMGIDVGGLNNVFLGNLPPAASNYRQRAGRAGRRPGAPAYILSLAASKSSHDRNYYRNIGELFFGKVQPPRIYLDRPVFAARHLRAEALHSFLSYLASRCSVSEWQWASGFILGIAHESVFDETAPLNAKGKHPYRGERLTFLDSDLGAAGDLCHKHLPGWLAAESRVVQEYVKGIPGISAVVFPGEYLVAEDLAFELLRLPGEPKFDGEILRALGSARLPEGDHESTDTKRMSLYDRLMAGLFYAGQHTNALTPYAFDDTAWLGQYAEAKKATEGGLNGLQLDLLDAMTIDVLSSTCILPKYGFPSDVVKLLPRDDDYYAKGLELSRPLVQGMFEYAPGQTVVANKRIFESQKARFTAWCGALTANATHAATGHADNAFRCRNADCGRVFKTSEIVLSAEGAPKCPVCGADVVHVSVVTPELFVAGISRRGGFEVVERRGRRILQPETGTTHKIHVPKLRLSTAEPPSHTIRIINAGSKGDGFDIGDGLRALYLHEIRTDIAIWEVDSELNLPATWSARRVENAFVSAFSALKRTLAKKLNITDRDVEGEYLCQDGHHKFVFFDMASGGGGFVLSVLMRSTHDAAAAETIKEVVEAAKALVAGCDCGDGICDSDHMPVTMAEYNTRTADDLVRPAVSCYGCLREYSNQDRHQKLDRHDAGVVLKALLYDEDPCLGLASSADNGPNSHADGTPAITEASHLEADTVASQQGETTVTDAVPQVPPSEAPTGFHYRKAGESVPIEKSYYLEGEASPRFCENVGDVADPDKVVFIED